MRRWRPSAGRCGSTTRTSTGCWRRRVRRPEGGPNPNRVRGQGLHALGFSGWDFTGTGTQATGSAYRAVSFITKTRLPPPTSQRPSSWPGSPDHGVVPEVLPSSALKAVHLVLPLRRRPTTPTRPWTAIGPPTMVGPNRLPDLAAVGRLQAARRQAVSRVHGVREGDRRAPLLDAPVGDVPRCLRPELLPVGDGTGGQGIAAEVDVVAVKGRTDQTVRLPAHLPRLAAVARVDGQYIAFLGGHDQAAAARDPRREHLAETPRNTPRPADLRVGAAHTAQLAVLRDQIHRLAVRRQQRLGLRAHRPLRLAGGGDVRAQRALVVDGGDQPVGERQIAALHPHVRRLPALLAVDDVVGNEPVVHAAEDDDVPYGQGRRALQMQHPLAFPERLGRRLAGDVVAVVGGQYAGLRGVDGARENEEVLLRPLGGQPPRPAAAATGEDHAASRQPDQQPPTRQRTRGSHARRDRRQLLDRALTRLDVGGQRTALPYAFGAARRGERRSRSGRGWAGPRGPWRGRGR